MLYQSEQWQCSTNNTNKFSKHSIGQYLDHDEQGHWKLLTEQTNISICKRIVFAWGRKTVWQMTNRSGVKQEWIYAFQNSPWQ